MKLSETHFFLFGMGNRRKLLYQNGHLYDALTSDLIRNWDITYEEITPSEYQVKVVCQDGGSVIISEDETGVWLVENGRRESLTEGKINLPKFDNHHYAPVLRVLHHEILINIVDGKPVPNFFVYRKPWYRDSAMMAICLETTGNVGLLKDWIMGLREPFDQNNAGNSEPDNLGQALYLISLVSDVSHPLVPVILEEVKKYQKENYIIGLSDFAEHPVYQTKWLKYGLKKLGLTDAFEIPSVYDSYSSLFWMDYRDHHVEGPRFNEKDTGLYPYLGWAEAHFYHEAVPWTIHRNQYPLTWEAEASQANYPGIDIISNAYSLQKIAAPHTWHAAEMFLMLHEK